MNVHINKTKFTHYSYVSQPGNKRKAVGLFDLSGWTIEERRALIHGFMSRSEILAVCPFGDEIQNLKQLDNALEWLQKEKDRNNYDDPRR